MDSELPQPPPDGLRSHLPKMKKKATGPSAQTVGTSLLGQGFIVVTGIVAARALGVDGRGTLALLWLLPLTMALLGGLGIPQATTYYVARAEHGARTVVRASVGLTAALATCVASLYALGLVLFGGGGSFSPADGVLSVILVPLLMAQNLAVASLLGMEEISRFNITRILPVCLYFASTLTLFVIGIATVTLILAACAASFAIAGLATWWLVLRDLPSAAQPSDLKRSEILSFGARGVIGTVSPVDDVRVDQVFVGLVLDSRALGLYVSAVAFSNLPRFIAQSIASVNYPRVASQLEAPQAWASALRAVRIGAVGVTATVAALIVALPHLLPLLFGEQFSPAVDIGYVLLVAAWFLSMHRLLTEMARGLGRPGYGSITELVNLAAFLLGLLAFATPASGTGVATAVVAGGVASFLMLSSMLAILRRKQLGQDS